MMKIKWMVWGAAAVLGMNSGMVMAHNVAHKSGGGLTVVGQGMFGGTGVHRDDQGLTFSADLAVESNFAENGSLFLYLNTAQGQGIDTGAATGANADNESGTLVANGAGFSDTRIAEAWYRYPFNDQVAVTVGKIDPTGIFDRNAVANDESADFLANAFINNPAIAFPGYAAGANVDIAITDAVTANLAWFEPTDDFFGDAADTFLIGEVAYAWDDGAVRVTAFNQDTSKNQGFAVNVDHALTSELTGFVRLGKQDSRQVFDLAVSLGGALSIDDDNTFGAGLSMLAATAPAADNETQYELYFSHAVNDFMTLTTDVQLVKNPGFDMARDNQTVYGIRMHVDFGHIVLGGRQAGKE